jgi:hypothetical protein
MHIVMLPAHTDVPYQVSWPVCLEQVGTHFGGSIFSMTDPFYMLMYMNILGKKHLVWDHSASIR